MFIQDAIEKKNLNKKLYFGKVPKNLAQQIMREYKINTEGYNLTLRADTVLKVFKSHGQEKTENSRKQRAVTKNDFQKIKETIEKPDSLLYTGIFENKPVIL